MGMVLAVQKEKSMSCRNDFTHYPRKKDADVANKGTRSRWCSEEKGREYCTGKGGIFFNKTRRKAISYHSSMGNRISESFKTAQSVMKGTWLTMRHSFMPIKKPGRKNSRSSQALSISKYKELHHFTLRFFSIWRRPSAFYTLYVLFTDGESMFSIRYSI